MGELEKVSTTASGEVAEADSDPAWRLAAGYLLGFSGHTRRAYGGDVRHFYSWCARAGVHPLEAARHHLNAYVRSLEELPQPKTGRAAAPTTVARRLSAIAGLYEYAIDEGVIER